MDLWRSGRRNPVTITTLVLLVAAGSLLGENTGPNTPLSDADKAIDGLQQVLKDVTNAVRRFNSHLDENIASHDQGCRLNGTQIQGADIDMTGGPADVMQLTVRKFAAFRMLAARSDRYQPAALADIDQIQKLIVESLRRVADSTTILRRLLVVSVKDLDRHGDAGAKLRHDQLLKARAGAEQAAKQAYLSLPINLPDAGSQDQTGQVAWDILVKGSPVGRSQTGPVSNATVGKSNAMEPILPLRIEHRRRFLLVSEPSYRMAMTDSGVEVNGQHVFYQEEWVRRGSSVIRKRWRVAVDTSTGEHVLMKRYRPIELQGSLEGLFRRTDRDYLWYVEPTDDPPQVSQKDSEAALAEVAGWRAAIGEAARGFSTTVRTELARDDQRSDADNKPLLDAGLADSVRESLFAIRAHLAKVPDIIHAESEVRQVIEDAERSIGDLEPLAALANRAPGNSTELDQFQRRAEREIDLVRTAEAEAMVWLPPDTSDAVARFPAFQKDTIVRLRRLSPGNSKDGVIRFIQEVWRPVRPMPGLQEVQRTATLVLVDPRTGIQAIAASKTKYYAAAQGDHLEEIFDENSSDELLFPTRS